MVIGLVITGVYYFAASSVFRREVEAHADIDNHYMVYRREVLGAIIASNMIVFIALFGLLKLPLVLDSFVGVAFVAPMFAAILSSSKRLNFIALAVTLLIYGFYIFVAQWGQGS